MFWYFIGVYNNKWNIAWLLGDMKSLRMFKIFQHWKRNFMSQHSHVISSKCCLPLWYFMRILENKCYVYCFRVVKTLTPYFLDIYRGYYTVARRYLTSERSERVRYCSCHENIKFISLSQRVMFFLLYGETNSTKAKGGNRDVIEWYNTRKGDIRKIRHSHPRWSGLWNLQVV